MRCLQHRKSRVGVSWRFAKALACSMLNSLISKTAVSASWSAWCVKVHTKLAQLANIFVSSHCTSVSSTQHHLTFCLLRSKTSGMEDRAASGGEWRLFGASIRRITSDDVSTTYSARCLSGSSCPVPRRQCALLFVRPSDSTDIDTNIVETAALEAFPERRVRASLLAEILNSYSGTLLPQMPQFSASSTSLSF